MRLGSKSGINQLIGSGLSCPGCGDEDWRVIESRPNNIGIRRRRECKNCRHRATSIEVLIDDKSSLVAISNSICEMKKRLELLHREASQMGRTLDQITSQSADLIEQVNRFSGEV